MNLPAGIRTSVSGTFLSLSQYSVSVLPFPPGVTAGAVRAGVYRLAVQRDANTVRETIKAGLDAFAASKGNGPYKVIADDLKARVDLFDAARLYPGDAQ